VIGGLLLGASEGWAQSEEPLDVMVFSRTEEFRHESIADAHTLFQRLEADGVLRATITEDPEAFRDEELSAFDVVVFANTTGDVLDDVHQAALVRFVRSGGGYVGVHAAADTEHGWAWYARLVGAEFVGHPLLPVAVTVTTEDQTHASTEHLPAQFSFTDEWYNFDRNPREDHHILLTVDEADIAGFTMGVDHPVAWLKEFEGGRSFYTNLGHRPETWNDPRFVDHLVAGMRWAAAPRQYNRIVLSDVARNPLALEVAPDGSIYYIERTGEVMRWDPVSGRTNEVAALEVESTAESGLLGIALDPNFAANGHAYLYHSPPKPLGGPTGDLARNILSRFTVLPAGVIDLGSRVDILAVPSERECCHEGGDLQFAPDGTLFLSTGDNTNPFSSSGYAPIDERPGRERWNAQRTAANPFELRGKILRINPDGTIPPGNLFPSDGSLGRPEIYAMGTRNPFRIAVDPGSGRLFWGDIGPDAFTDGSRGPRGYDELNVADAPGNYGWPFCIAANLPYNDYDFATETSGTPFSCAGFVPAVMAYDYHTFAFPALGSVYTERAGFAGRTLIAGAFYSPPAGARFALPGEFRDTLLVTEWTRDILAAARIDGAATLESLTRVVPYEPFVAPIDIDVGPDGAIYVLEFGSDLASRNADARLSDIADARLSRIEYAEDGVLTPVAAIQATRTNGSAPLEVTFSSTGARGSHRDDGIAAYEWDFGDGNTSTTPSVTHTFAQTGVYDVTLSVVTTSGARSFPNVRRIVVGNNAPQVTILCPPNRTLVDEGDEVTIIGEGTDVEDGTIACDDLTWNIRLGHNAHSHPLVEKDGCAVTLTAILGDHGGEEGDLFYVVELLHTDAGGPSGEPTLTGTDEIIINVKPSDGPTCPSWSETEQGEFEACSAGCRDVLPEGLESCVLAGCADVLAAFSAGCIECGLGVLTEQFGGEEVPTYDEVLDALAEGCGGGAAGMRMQSAAQQRCIRAGNKLAAGVADAQARADERCIKRTLRGTETNPQGCLTRDAAEGIRRAQDAVDVKLARRCKTAPDFGTVAASEVREAPVQMQLGLMSDLFGNLDTALLPRGAGGRCQAAVTNRAHALIRRRLGAFRRCSADGLKTGAITSAAGLVACADAAGSRGKVMRARRKLGIAVSKRCSSSDLGAAFPGDGACGDAADFAACVAARVEYRVCTMLEAVDGLDLNCRVAEGTCSLRGSARTSWGRQVR